jgi:hypothetical protein
MRTYVRTSRNTGVSMPFWLALLVAAIWFCVMLLAFAGMVILAAVLFVVRFAQQQYLLRRRS